MGKKKQVRVENKSSPREGRWGGGMQGGKGCRESEAPETQAETPVNPVLGENRPKHQLFQRLWESKCL